MQALSATIPLYMTQGNLFRINAIVTGIGEIEFKKKKVVWVRLNETIFHPQGGGQPSDKGTIGGLPVLHVNKDRTDRIDQFEISHYFDIPSIKDLLFSIGQSVEVLVDEPTRKMHCKLHTGGHLLSDMVGKHFSLEGFTGNHSPSDSWVKFKMKESVEYSKEVLATLQAAAEKECQEYVNQKLSVVLTEKDGTRAIQIEGFAPVPCGGTHATNLADLGKFEVTGASVNKKEQTVTVKYKLPEAII